MASPMIGIDPTKTRTSSEGAEFLLGSVGQVQTSSGLKEYVYVSSAALQVVGNVCQVTGAFAAVAATLTTSAPGNSSGYQVAVAVSAIPAGGFGWMQVYGVGAVSVLASAVLNTQLNTTATGGALDDDATASSEVVDGIRLTATNGGSPAVVAAFLNRPQVGRTL